MKNSTEPIELQQISKDSRRWEEIVTFVMEHDREFLPPISERMQVRDYIERFRSPNGVVIIASDANGIVGLMACFLQHPERGTPFVQYGAVAKEYRKAGVGILLLQRTLQELTNAGCGHVESRTWSTNEGSQKLLMSQGFTLTERLINDRGPGVDTLVYERSL